MAQKLPLFMALTFIVAVGALTTGLLDVLPSVNIPLYMWVFMFAVVLFMAGNIYSDFSG